MCENEMLNLHYYYRNIDREKSELILRSINRPGCFLIRNHQKRNSSLIESPYVLSLIGPSLKIFHYLLYRIDKHLSLQPFSNQLFNSLKDFVDQHRESAGTLPSILLEYPVRLDSNSLSSCNIKSSFPSYLNIPPNKLVQQELIGRGHFGLVYKGLYNGEIPVALKTFSISCLLSEEECQLNTLIEGRTMINLDHPYLLHFYGISSFDNRLCLVTEYISDGSLLFWLHKQEEKDHRNYFRRRLGIFSLQICDAMDYLQTKSIIHRDLAARNCLIDDNANIVKVSDFGMAKISSSMNYEGRWDTPFPLRWSSPEVLLYRKYSSKSDVWSYGILLTEIYSLGQIPFGQSISNDLVAQLIRSGQIPERANLANELIYKQIISSCWAYQPNERPSFASLKERFSKILCI